MKYSEFNALFRRRAELLVELAAIDKEIESEKDEVEDERWTSMAHLRGFARRNGFSDIAASRLSNVLSDSQLQSLLTEIDPGITFPVHDMPRDPLILFAIAPHMKPGIITGYGAIINELFQKWVASLAK